MSQTRYLVDCNKSLEIKVHKLAITKVLHHLSEYMYINKYYCRFYVHFLAIRFLLQSNAEILLV